MSLLCRATRLQAILNAHRLQKAVATNLAQTAAFHNRRMIGKREVVGHGSNGSYVYWDGCENPYPAIRFREENDEIKKLLEKGKDDWKKLTLEEKKTRMFTFLIGASAWQLTTFILFGFQCIDTTFASLWLKLKLQPANGRFTLPSSLV